MEKKICKMCGEKIISTNEKATICSNECFLVWIETDEFDTELCKALGITKEKDEKSNNI
jgi:hypothetical protein